jgi:hypothetical protein
MEPGPSALELLHPDGVARRAAVIGGGCPDALTPRRSVPGEGEHADLIVIAPTLNESSDRSWLERAVETTASTLAPDGIVYVLSPRRCRWRLVRLLARRGIEVKVSLAHDPDTERVRCLVPLSSGPAAYAFTNLVATRPRRRKVVLFVLRSAWLAQFLARALPAVGIAAGRPTSRPLFDWVFALTGDDVPAPVAVVSVSWRGAEGSLVAHGFEGGAARPAVVAKVGGPAGPGPVEEAAVLRRLGPAAREAGATVPEPLFVETGKTRGLMLQSPLEGRVAAAILGDTPGLVTRVTARLTDWLENWNLDTRSDELLSFEWLDREIVGPARGLAPLLGDGARYVDWLSGRCRSLAGTTAPLVATHNDLTMVNVFVEHSGALGVVDWEGAKEKGLPLMDFYYAAADATAAASRYANRQEAFVAVFGSAADSSSLIRQLESRLTRALDLTPAFVDLAFHACWIKHASAEQRATSDAAPHPFLEILRSVANLAVR